MSGYLILDAGPWVALHCSNDTHHAWAKAQFAQHAAPFLTCEAVVAETCFLLARSGFDPSRAITTYPHRLLMPAWCACQNCTIRAAC